MEFIWSRKWSTWRGRTTATPWTKVASSKDNKSRPLQFFISKNPSLHFKLIENEDIIINNWLGQVPISKFMIGNVKNSAFATIWHSSLIKVCIERLIYEYIWDFGNLSLDLEMLLKCVIQSKPRTGQASRGKQYNLISSLKFWPTWVPPILTTNQKLSHLTFHWTRSKQTWG